MLLTDRTQAVGHDKYPGVVRTINNALIGIAGEWEAKITVMRGKTKAFCTRVADSQDGSKIRQGDGLSVFFVMRYGEKDTEKEAAFEVRAVFKDSDGEDQERELELILAVLRAWAKEEIYPNARMAINARELLELDDDDIQDCLERLNFPAIIWPHTNS